MTSLTRSFRKFYPDKLHCYFTTLRMRIHLHAEKNSPVLHSETNIRKLFQMFDMLQNIVTNVVRNRRVTNETEKTLCYGFSQIIICEWSFDSEAVESETVKNQISPIGIFEEPLYRLCSLILTKYHVENTYCRLPDHHRTYLQYNGVDVR